MIAAALSLLAAPLAPAAPGLSGTTWRNPSNSVHVRFAPCGPALCGTIVWASPKARADAAQGGAPDLVGTRVFSNLQPSGPNMWAGDVYVPDIGQTFSGSVTLQGNRLTGRGCLMLNLACKEQTWTRMR